MHTNLPARLWSSQAVRSGIANAATTLVTTGLIVAAASLRRRRQLNRSAEARAEADQRAYEHFVRDFGSADELSDSQLAALTTYIASRVDQWIPSVVAELLRGCAWNWRDDNDDLDEEHPRVQHITAVVDGLAHAYPVADDTTGEVRR